MLFCRSCGAMVGESDTFCTNCLQRLDVEGMVIDRRTVSSIKAAGNVEFDADAVCVESDLTGFKVLGYMLSRKRCSLCDSDYYDAVSEKNGGAAAVIRHLYVPDRTGGDIYSLLYKTDKNGGVFEEYAVRIKNLVMSFREKCSIAGVDCVNCGAEVFNSGLYGCSHIFVLMNDVEPLLKFISKRQLTLRNVIKIGIELSETILKLKSRGIIYGGFSDLSIFSDKDGKIFLGFPFTDLRRSFFPFDAVSQYENLFISPTGENLEAYSLAMVLYRLLSGFGNPYINSYVSKITNEDLKKAELMRLEGSEGMIPEKSRNMFGAKIVEALNVKRCTVTIEELHNVLVSTLNYISASELDEIIIDGNLSL